MPAVPLGSVLAGILIQWMLRPTRLREFEPRGKDYAGDRRPCKGRKERTFLSSIEFRAETLPAVRAERRRRETRAELTPRAAVRAEGRSPEARAELGFELRRCRGAAGDESGEARAGWISGEARAEIEFRAETLPAVRVERRRREMRAELTPQAAVRAEGRSPEVRAE